MSKWQLIETVPPQGKVLICGGTVSSYGEGSIEFNEVATASYNGSFKCWVGGYDGKSGVFLHNPTHWMPLPELPKEKQVAQVSPRQSVTFESLTPDHNTMFLYWLGERGEDSIQTWCEKNNRKPFRITSIIFGEDCNIRIQTQGGDKIGAANL